MGNEEEQKQALNDYLKTSFESMKHKKRKKIVKMIVIFLTILLFFYIIFHNPFTFIFVAKKDLRYYDVRLNDYQLSVSEKIPDTTIIPKLIVIPNGNTGKFDHQNKEEFISIKEKELQLTIKSYTCFIPNKDKKINISCNEQSEKHKNRFENNDTSYTRMQILKYDYESKYEYNINHDYLSRSYLVKEDSWYSRPYEEYTIVYDGKFIEDIQYYVSETNVYVIKIEASYKNSKAILSFGFIKDGENMIPL